MLFVTQIENIFCDQIDDTFSREIEKNRFDLTICLNLIEYIFSNSETHDFEFMLEQSSNILNFEMIMNEILNLKISFNEILSRNSLFHSNFKRAVQFSIISRSLTIFILFIFNVSRDLFQTALKSSSFSIRMISDDVYEVFKLMLHDENVESQFEIKFSVIFDYEISHQ